MSRSDANDPGWEKLDDSGELEPARWPLAPTGVLLPREKWLWFQQLWTDVCSLRDRYRGDLPIRSGWWENQLHVEALAALAAWVDRYDSGEWDDPPGKLALLYEIERVAALLRDDGEPFQPRPRPGCVHAPPDRARLPATKPAAGRLTAAPTNAHPRSLRRPGAAHTRPRAETADLLGA